MRIYEMIKEIEELDRMLLDTFDNETGEVKDESLADSIISLQETVAMLMQEKSEELVKYCISEESEISSIKQEMDRLSELKAKKEKRIKGLKEGMKYCMLKTGTEKINTASGVIKITKSKSTEVLDEFRVPDEFKITKTTTSVSKELLKKFLEKEGDQDFAVIRENKNLKIG